jgi:hypothetical protein
MSGHELPPGLKDKIVSTCFGLLAAAIALYYAVRIIESIWPWLVGIGGTVLLVWLAIVAIRTWRERW